MERRIQPKRQAMKVPHEFAIPSEILDWMCEDNFCVNEEDSTILTVATSVHKTEVESLNPNTNFINGKKDSDDNINKINHTTVTQVLIILLITFNLKLMSELL